jgi:hypothetical protein
VAANALHRQIEPVGNPRVASARAVNRHRAIDLVARKDHHATDRVAQAIERFALHFRDPIDDVRHPRPPRPERNHRIARQPELAKLRAMV